MFSRGTVASKIDFVPAKFSQSTVYLQYACSVLFICATIYCLCLHNLVYSYIVYIYIILCSVNFMSFCHNLQEIQSCLSGLGGRMVRLHEREIEIDQQLVLISVVGSFPGLQSICRWQFVLQVVNLVVSWE